MPCPYAVYMETIILGRPQIAVDKEAINDNVETQYIDSRVLDRRTKELAK